MAPIRTSSRFWPFQFIASVTLNRPAVWQPICSPIFLPLSHTAVPNWALPMTSTAESRLAPAANVRSYHKKLRFCRVQPSPSPLPGGGVM